MAKKKQDDKPKQAPVNPELLDVEKQYRREVALVKAKPRLKNFLLLAWITIDVVLVAIFVFYFFTYFISGAPTERQLVAGIGNNVASMHSVTEARSASVLTVSDVTVFSLGGTDYDLYVEVENPNAEWYATFDYSFTSSQGDSELLEGSVMPSSTRQLAQIRQEFDSRPVNPELVIDNLVWHRVDPVAVLDTEAFMADHEQFKIDGATYNFDLEIDGDPIPRSSFTITNNSPYSYWSPEFTVTIDRAGRVSGVNLVTIPGLSAGETRTIDVNWFGSAPTSGSVVVTPNINYFDESVYMDPMGDVDIDLRDRF